MRRLACLLVLVVACGEDDNKVAPDTALDSTPDALTNDAHAVFFFRSIGTSNEFVCVVDNGTPALCIPPAAIDLADGMHTFSVAAAFNTNVDESPATFSWRIDTAPPETSLVLSPPALDNDATPELTFEGTDAEGTVTFECVLDGGAAAPCTSPHGIAVTDGPHTFTVTAIDLAGNRDASPATHTWTVNTTTPDTLITSGPSAGQTTAASVAFEFTSPDPTATFQCSTDAAAFAACTSPVALKLANGDHEFAVRAVGIAGPDPSPATVAWTVDAIAPPSTITATPTNPSNDATPQFMFTSTDATATFECQIDGVVTFAACTSPFESPTLANGNRTFRVRATDPVGNVGAPATFTWAIDTTIPTVTLTASPLAISTDNTPTVAFTTTDNPTSITCRLDAGTFVTCTSPFTFGATADGTHTITVRVADAAGNASTATTAPFTIDTVIPTVTITSAPLANSNDNTPTVVFVTTDNPTVVQCRIDATAFASCASPFTFGATADGLHTITVRVADAANNASTAVTPQFRIDTVTPTVSITSSPAALTNDNTPNVAFTVTDSPTTITCQLDAATPINCTSPFAFAVAADGPHTITVRVADGAGNASSQTTAPFTIDTVATVTITAQPNALSND
ncbi:MAG: Ig-like domain-containing protein, partial [Kofleriaceae bacterium]